MKGRPDGLANVNRGFLGLDEEAPRAASGAKTVVRRFDASAHANRVLVDDLFIGVGVALAIVDVPTEGLEQRIDELLAELGLVVLAGLIGRPMGLEPLDQFAHD